MRSTSATEIGTPLGGLGSSANLFGPRATAFFTDRLLTGVFYGAVVYLGIQTVGGLLGLDQPLTDALSNAGLEELLLVNH